MVPEAEVQDVLDELQRLRARVPLLSGALAASTDGLVVAQDTPGVEAEGVAALTAAAPGHVRSVRENLFDVLSAEQVGQLAEICRAMLGPLTADPDARPVPAACTDRPSHV